MNDTGLYINELLDSFSEVTVLNNGIATHVRGGVLDLTILSTSPPHSRLETTPLFNF